MKYDWNEQDFKTIRPFGAIEGFSGTLGIFQVQSGSIRGCSGQLEVILRLSGLLHVSIIMNFCVEEPHFVSQISQPPGIGQKWFCIQNFCTDLSFKEKKNICNSIQWFLRYWAKRKVVTFFGTPCTSKIDQVRAF